jgi:prophage maintenance system killer protein
MAAKVWVHSIACTAIFLRMNGYRLSVDPDEGESFLIDQVIQQKVEIETIAARLEDSMLEAV